MLENKMLLDEYWQSYNKDLDEYYEAMAEKEDREWRDNLDD